MKAKGGVILVVAVMFLLGLALSIWLILQTGLGAIVTAFQEASWWTISGYVLISVLIAVGLTVKWRVVLDAYGISLPFYTLFAYRLIGFAVQYVTPAAHVGGEPVRALLLDKQGIPLKVGFATAIVDRSIELLFNVVFFFIGALIIVNTAAFPLRERLLAVVLSLILVSAASILVANIIGKRRVLVPLCERLGMARFRKWRSWRHAVNEMELLIEHFYANRRRHFNAAVVVNILLWVLMYFEYKFALFILGYNADLLSIFVFLTGVGIAYSIPVPAALGVLELGQITAATLLGVSPAIALALALVVRSRDILWAITGIVLTLFLHLNVFRLLERSQRAAKEYNFAMLQVELRGLRREQKSI